ncbi:MAG: primosomal protein N' [Vampirovibrionales bacterium]
MFLCVLPLIDVASIADAGYTYRYTNEKATFEVGQLVRISWGSHRHVVGLVLQAENVPPPPPTVFCKSIEDSLSPSAVVPPALLQRLKWIASTTGTSLAATIKAALPSPFFTAKPHHFTPKQSVVYHLASPLEQTPDSPPAGLTRRQLEVWQQLQRLSETAPSQGWSQSWLIEQLQTTKGMLEKLVQAGCLSSSLQANYRDPLTLLLSADTTKSHHDSPTWFTLNAQQQAVVQQVQANPNQAFLLHGITGAGKTEVYMELARQALLQGKQVLVLLPEIALTGALAQRFVKRFGQQQVAVWHSQLNQGERLDTWYRIQQGLVGIVIAARSGIFTPLQEVGLLIVDECHDDSFKQDQPAPRYDARQVLRWWQQQQGCPLLLGSATPTVTQYYEATETHELQLLELTERFGEAQLPSIFLVDMRDEQRKGLGNRLFASGCLEALKQTLANHEQAIVLMNRRGYQTHVQCSDCGHVFQCPSCSVGITYHASQQQVKCHHCGYTSEPPVYCPVCASKHIVRSGAGTQRVEEELRQHLGETARLLRLDADVLQQRHSLPQLLGAFSKGEADVLIGTQLVAKGLDVSNVTLVIVLNTDASLALPDYKTLERGYQLISQVAGRAGRGSKAGRVYLQTFQPEHPVIQFAKRTAYQGFYEYDLRQRQPLAMPPFGLLFRLVVATEHTERTQQFAVGLVHHLKEALLQALQQTTANLAETEQLLAQGVLFLGPVPCMIERLQNFVRHHVLIKVNKAILSKQQQDTLQQATADWFRALSIPTGIRCALDTDCQSLF